MTLQSNHTDNDMDKVRRCEDAAHFWSANDVSVDNSEEVNDEIRARVPLAMSISLRLTDEEAARLRTMAKAENVGVTAMARILLRAGLDIRSQESGKLRELDAVEVADD